MLGCVKKKGVMWWNNPIFFIGKDGQRGAEISEYLFKYIDLN